MKYIVCPAGMLNAVDRVSGHIECAYLVTQV